MAASPADLPDPLDRSNDLSLGNPDDLISQLAGEEIARLLAPDANWQPELTPPAAAPQLEPTPPPRAKETPVEELAAQLDQLFEEIRQGKPAEPPPAAAAAARPRRPAERAAPERAAPQHVAAEWAPPDRVAPERVATERAAWERVAAERVVVDETFPDDMEPEPFLAEPVLVMRRRADEIDEGLRGEPRQTLIAPLDEDPLPPVLRPLAWLNAPVMELGGRARMLVSAVSLLSFVGSVGALVYVIVLRQQQG